MVRVLESNTSLVAYETQVAERGDLMEIIRIFGKAFWVLAIMISGWSLTCSASYVNPENYGSPKGEICITCHRETSPGIYNQWKEGAHGQAGVNCYDCHRAEAGDPDVFDHKELISIVVTPKDCSRCHDKEYREFTSSRHADAVSVLDSDNNFFGRASFGSQGQWTGCISCHGSKIKVAKEGKLSAGTWPNTGIGRINPDGSKGSCTACHTRHLFSIEQARRPESCGKCHTGPAQPQIEVYTRSKHGIMYAAYRNRMDMQKPLWRAGQEAYPAPTCATCHMSAIPPQMDIETADERIRTALESILPEDRELVTALLPPTEPTEIDYGVSHDVGERLSWTLAPSISAKRENWEENRRLMQSVCLQCHGEYFVNQHYEQFDNLIKTYNENFAAPANRMLQELSKEKEITAVQFDDRLELIFWKMWSEGGHGARSGAAMAGPVYFWNQGMQEVSEQYYMEFIPEVKNILGPKAEKFLKDHGYVEPVYKK